MPHVERITARIIELMGARGWVVARSDTEDEWTVSGPGQDLDVVLALPREDVRTYVDGRIAHYLPHEVLDGIGTGAIEDDLADQAAQRLSDLLTTPGPGKHTEIGIRRAGSSAEIYAVRALRAAGHDVPPTRDS